MNWNAVDAISEAVGSIAVIVSVAYLAVQVRKQTQEARLAATRELAAQYQAGLRAISENGELAAIWLRGVQNYEALPNVERIRVALFFQLVCRVMEQQFLHTQRSHVDATFFESMDLSFVEFLTFPGAQQWWQASKAHFAVEFRDRVDAMVEVARQRGYRSSFASREDATAAPAR